ncbi:MAG: hypothetical protein CVU51_00490 [Deltaproteobacteria bacterium HGW-Deltaproteobacteria-1]|nr:MAG: hypothetical protein CVU51_00490 [Deltaproteobacteria bacterium HGW-Deltaproteobacteria-1]
MLLGKTYYVNKIIYLYQLSRRIPAFKPPWDYQNKKTNCLKRILRRKSNFSHSTPTRIPSNRWLYFFFRIIHKFGMKDANG